jgi:twitching motility protein PilT
MLVTSLLTAIVRADGDALVMHVGEPPYVVTSGGHVDLLTSGLALEAMSGMLTQLLPPDAMRVLSEFGAVEHELRPPQGFHDRFTVVAARGGDDIWIEIRRTRQLPVAPASAREESRASYGETTPERLEMRGREGAPPPPEVVEPEPASARAETPPSLVEASSAAAPVAELSEVPSVPDAPNVPEAPSLPDVPNVPEAPSLPDVPSVPQVLAAETPAAEPVITAPPVAEVSEVPSVPDAPNVPEAPSLPDMPSVPEVLAPETPEPEPVITEPPSEEIAEQPVVAEDELYELMASETPAVAGEETPAEPVAPVPPETVAPVAPEPVVSAAPETVASVSARAETDASYGEISPKRPEVEREGGPATPTLVVPLTRTVRIEVPPRNVADRQAGVDRFLSIAGARGASVLYLTSQSRPFMRVDGEIRAMDGEAPLTGADVEAAVLELMPESAREAHGRGEPAEWVSEFEGLGRIRCTTFRDYRGPGAIFHLISARAISAEQLGLSREIQALATESEGLVLVAGPRGGGKSTLLAALVDLINRNDGGYIISLERQIRIVHDNRQSLVSQREVRGTSADAVNVARAALRENPDVLVIEDLNSPEVIQLALDAAGSGLLVFLSITAGSTVSALERIVDLFPPERRKAVQAVLAERLRAAVSQVLLRKVGGGRLAARELLLTTTAVASLIAEGQIAQLPVAIDSGRKLGMVSLNEALVGFLRSGLIEPREAYRKADDRAGLLALLKRDGADTSVVDRLA